LASLVGVPRLHQAVFAQGLLKSFEGVHNRWPHICGTHTPKAWPKDAFSCRRFLWHAQKPKGKHTRVIKRCLQTNKATHEHPAGRT